MPVRLRSGETADLVTYLTQTPVAVAAAALARGELVAYRDSIQTRAELGAFPTIYGNLGGITAKELHGRDKFRVSEVLAVLCRSDCQDVASRDAVTSMIEAERAGTLVDRRLTALRDASGTILIDGNKRAIAIYEAGVADMPLPIVVLAAASA